MVSAKAKTLVAGVIQLTIKRLGKTDFHWGDIPTAVAQADRDKILDDASKLYTDVKVPERDREFVKENMSLDLAAEDFLDEDVSEVMVSGIWDNIHDLKPEPFGAKQKAQSLSQQTTRRVWRRPLTPVGTTLNLSTSQTSTG